jgi:hypothetical protein
VVGEPGPPGQAQEGRRNMLIRFLPFGRIGNRFGFGGNNAGGSGGGRGGRFHDHHLQLGVSFRLKTEGPC